VWLNGSSKTAKLIFIPFFLYSLNATLIYVCMHHNVSRPLGETMYIGQYEPRRWVEEYPFGVITPSQEMIAFCDYNDKELTLKLCVRYEALTGTDNVIFYWKSSDEYLQKSPMYFPEDIVYSNKTRYPLFYFVARVDPHIIKESKVVGSYNKSKFPADFDGPLVGVGHAWYIEGTCDQNHRTPIGAFNVYVPYDGKIFEVPRFSFLCSHRLPRLSHLTYPRENWVKMYSQDLPPNAFPAGMAPDREVLYVGRAEHVNYDYGRNDLIPGYVTYFEMHLHITRDHLELLYDSNDVFELLVVEDPDLLEWVVDSQGKAPENAVVGGRGEFGNVNYIGRTITGSDLSVGKDRHNALIKLPDDMVANTQLVGKVCTSRGCLCVGWNGDEYYYEKYEVLVLRKWFSPKDLQRLCRNAIITLTMGMPDLVDKLNLPSHLKDFCKVSGFSVD